jgi:CheY-like chemotaxis protein
VLVDAGLEESDGSVLRQLRDAPKAVFEPIILIAPTDRGRLQEYRAHGYATFLARPVRGETLVRMLLAGGLKSVQPGPGSAGPSPADEGRAGGGLSVLLAEDNEINAMLARVALTKAGHRVHVVPNGRAAVDAVTELPIGQRYDVILMDLHMPVMDGLDAIAMIRKYEEEKDLPPRPIMVLSADGQEKTRHVVLAHGARGFVTKPLDPRKLLEAVEEQAAA